MKRPKELTPKIKRIIDDIAKGDFQAIYQKDRTLVDQAEAEAKAIGLMAEDGNGNLLYNTPLPQDIQNYIDTKV